MASVPDQSNVRRRQYISGAGQTNFTYPFKIFEAEDLEVFQQIADGTIIELTLNSEYTVTNVGLEGGGDVVLVNLAALNDIITINSNVPASQTVDFSVGGKFDPATVNFVHDKEAILIQQVENRMDERMLTYLVTDILSPTGGDTVLPLLPANTGAGIPIWTKNSAGNLVAGVCSEDPDCSTLRSELASQTMTAPGTDIVGVYDANDPAGAQGKILTTLLQELNPISDDRNVIKNTADNSKTIKFNADAISATTARTIFMPDRDVDLGHIGPSTGPLGAGVIRGLTIENDVSDLNLHIKFNPGVGVSSDHSFIIDLLSPLVKHIENPWAEGDAQGGLFPGVLLAPDETYHEFLIVKNIDKTIDAGFDTDVNAANIPLGYTLSLRVASLKTDSGGNLYQFLQFANDPSYFLLKTMIIVNNELPQPSVRTFIDIQSPADLNLRATLRLTIRNDNASNQQKFIVTNPEQEDVNPFFGNPFTVGNEAAVSGTTDSNVIFDVLTDQSSQVGIRGQTPVHTNQDYLIALLGWHDTRGNI